MDTVNEHKSTDIASNPIVTIHYDILDESRKNILPLLKNFRDIFYLAGETGLTLQLGHRDSVDFDFFTDQQIDTKKLFEKITTVFCDYTITKIQEEHNTLSVFMNQNIKLSFFHYPYPLIDTIVEDEWLRIASIKDIACMKLSAIVSRATNKDYIDLYFILQNINLAQLLSAIEIKFKNLDTNLVLKSLVYFKDVQEEPIRFINNHVVDWNVVCTFLTQEVKKLHNLL